MIHKFSAHFDKVVLFSHDEAVRQACSKVVPEHLLLGILCEHNELLGKMFKRLEIDVSSIRSALNDFFLTMTERANMSESPSMSLEVQGLLCLAVHEARQLQQSLIGTEHLLLAILDNQINSKAKMILNDNHLNYEQAKEFLHNQLSREEVVDGIDMADDEDETEKAGYSASNRQSVTLSDTKQSKTPMLDNFSFDLTAAANAGKLDPIVGREKEIHRLTEILCRRKKNNPILIGEPGVGKSAIVEGLAQLIAQRKTSPILYGKRIVNLDMTAIVAGTKFRGQFEERLRALLKELEQNPDILVFIDEIHTIIGAGSTPGSMDAANIMKPALARGTIQCIGATTLDEYRNSIEKDGALERRFQKIMVEPTTEEETLQILKNVKDRYEAHHHVNYHDKALEACVKLTGRYVNDRFFPDKAIDALDEAGARVHLASVQLSPEIKEKEIQLAAAIEKKKAAVKQQNFELAASYRDQQKTLEHELKEIQERWKNDSKEMRGEVTETDIAQVVATMTGIPVQRMAEKESVRLLAMPDVLRQKVIAQDKAIEKVTKAIMRNRIGLKDANHPIGVFMFLGPTGVGKTYLAKQLARYLFGSDDALIRIDMSEYAESFNTSRLVGAPPGYVGYNEGGQLTERVRRHPYSIVLLDEIEKAHGNVFNMLLQVLDEGRMTDGNGRLIDFRNTIIIMTSNAGTRQLKEFGRGVGFNAGNAKGWNMDEKDKEYARGIVQKSLSKQFAPEFLNRLDEIITFDQLDRAAIQQIIEIELAALNQRIAALGYQVELTDAAKSFITEKGYDVQFGARPMKRAIQTYVEDALCEYMLASDEATAVAETEEGAQDSRQPVRLLTLHKEEGEEKLTIS